MITRAHIRRQLRASGGITNAMNGSIGGGSIGGGIIQGNPMGTRTGYFNPFKAAKKAVDKVLDVGAQVVKSPIGKAALIGLGGAGLMGLGGPFSSLSGLGARIGTGLSGLKGSLLGLKGVGEFGGTTGLLGKLGLTEGFGGGLTGLGKMLGAGGLVGYFTSKGASEEEAKELAQDVYRGKGIGFDQIRADLNKYRSGELSQSQMFDKNYRFLTPRNFVGAEGGRVGLRQGSPEEGIKSLEAGALPIKVEGDVRPAEMKMAAYRPGKLINVDKMPRRKLVGHLNAMELPETNARDFDDNHIRQILIDFAPDIFTGSWGSNSYAQGGRVGLRQGGDPLPEDPTKPINPFGPKPTGPVLPNKMAEIPKGLSMQDAVKTFTLSNGRKPKSVQEVIEFFKNRKLSAMGGIMDMPTGNMRRNQAGVMERDYRDKGGFVPVGVKEKADDVPAMLSKNEFVMTADAVRGAGNGNIKKGAQRMYDLMKRNEGKVA